MPLEEAALASIQQHGAASATTIAQLLFPQRTPAACAKLVSRTWRPALQRRRTGTGRGCPPSTAIATAAELDCVLSATNDAGECCSTDQLTLPVFPYQCPVSQPITLSALYYEARNLGAPCVLPGFFVWRLSCMYPHPPPPPGCMMRPAIH